MASQSRAEVSKWVFIIAIYVIVSSFVFTMFTSISTEYSLENNNSYTTINFDSVYSSGGICSNSADYFSTPYVKQFLTNGTINCESIQVNKILDNNNPTDALYSEVCTSFKDCTFTTREGVFDKIINALGGNSSTPICSGIINNTYYNFNDLNSKSVCINDGSLYNQNQCLKYGCTWLNSSVVNDNIGVWNSLNGNNEATNLVKALLGVNINLGLPDPYQTYFNLLFVTMPRIILIFAIVILIIG